MPSSLREGTKVVTAVNVRRPLSLQLRVLEQGVDAPVYVPPARVQPATVARQPGDPASGFRPATMPGLRSGCKSMRAPCRKRARETLSRRRTRTWYRQMVVALQAEGITGLNEEIRQAVILPGEAFRDLPAPARLLHVLRDSPEAFPLTTAGDEEYT